MKSSSFNRRALRCGFSAEWTIYSDTFPYFLMSFAAQINSLKSSPSPFCSWNPYTYYSCNVVTCKDMLYRLRGHSRSLLAWRCLPSLQKSWQIMNNKVIFTWMTETSVCQQNVTQTSGFLIMLLVSIARSDIRRFIQEQTIDGRFLIEDTWRGGYWKVGDHGYADPYARGIDILCIVSYSLFCSLRFLLDALMSIPFTSFCTV